MGPVTVRQSVDVLIPSLTRTFELLNNEWNFFSPAPEELVGMTLEPYFTSDFVVTQRQSWLARSNEAAQWLMNVGVPATQGQINNSVDYDQWLRHYERSGMLPPFVVRSKQEVDEALQVQAQQAQQAQQMQSLAGVAGIAKDLANVPTQDGSTAATQLMESM